MNDTLAERGSRYGEFKAHAEITQDLKDVMRDASGWKRLTASMKEALEMVAHKIGRILNGDPTYADSWHDIAGYAQLVDVELTTGTDPTPPAAPATTRPTPPEFKAPGPKTTAEFAQAVTPKAEPATEVIQGEVPATEAVKALDAPEEAEEGLDADASPVNFAKTSEAAAKLPDNVSKYVAPKAPAAPVAPVAPTAPVIPAKKD